MEQSQTESLTGNINSKLEAAEQRRQEILNEKIAVAQVSAEKRKSSTGDVNATASTSVDANVAASTSGDANLITSSSQTI